MRLVGTWTVTAVTGATVPADDRHRPWLTFDGDGQVYGMSGVNRVRGTWSVEGDVLTFGPLASTMMAGPPDAMTLEHALHTLLAGPLTLHTADGAAASSADPLLDPSAAGAGRPAIVDLLASDGALVELRRTTPRN
ncbi:META domain-containing protein [Cellulomonas rhizosphaerae]|uniref:META domain-containing protein n=1 Tax=Cellulomonas rhizosphaerae TaxID=2293719 RepID=A0A413RJ76_9CELL|nr:META domain-containing protein [Cellulomonas rhizosphaerae]RHA38506.1 META domain-containing protein [Cellulomonas rhizosphaerae]